MANDSLNPDQLEERLLNFGIAVCRSVSYRRNDLASRHIALQMIASSTSPAANYSEACAAESTRDFIHKMQIVLKELRETRVWLRFRAGVSNDKATPHLTAECAELMAIIGAGIRTARRRKEQ